MPEQKLRRWKAQALFLCRVRKGSTSRELSCLRDARKRIKELEGELHLMKYACEILTVGGGGPKIMYTAAIKLLARDHSQRMATKTAGVPRSVYGARRLPRPPWALEIAVRTREIAKEWIQHADHGPQFTAWARTTNLAAYGIRLSRGTVAIVMTM